MIRFFVPAEALNLGSTPPRPGQYDRVGFEVDGDPKRRTFRFTRKEAEILASAILGAPLRRGDVVVSSGSLGRQWRPKYEVALAQVEGRVELTLGPIDDRVDALDRVPPGLTVVLTGDEAGVVARGLDSAIAEVAELRRRHDAESAQ